MLSELRIENLLLIERAEMRADAGLVAITGETGAGKSVFAHAFDLLLGGKPRRNIVRPGAAEAYVEGVFVSPEGLLDGLDLDELRENIGEIAGGDEIILARRVSAEGRSRALIQGRSASASDLNKVANKLVAFFGQHEHRRLMLRSAQLDLLDSFAGSELGELRKQYTLVYLKVRELRRELEAVRKLASNRDGELDLLRFELDEIDELDPTEREKKTLVADQKRLSQLDGLRRAAAAGLESLVPTGLDENETSQGVQALLAAAEQSANEVLTVDATLDKLIDRVSALALEVEDLGLEFRHYLDSLDLDPGTLHEIEEKLANYDRLERKHGGSLAGVLERAESARIRIRTLEQVESKTSGLEQSLNKALAQEQQLAKKLSRARRRSAPRLAAAVREELRTLGMGDAQFDVVLEERSQHGSTGAEDVELMLSPNPGLPAAPIRESASGGELSRVMLALITVAGADDCRTMVFDEVDAGVGGKTARVLGQRLQALGKGRQVFCITHLPQVAAAASTHFRIEKSLGKTGALTTVEALSKEAVVSELCRMLGAESQDAAARRHAKDLLAAA